jgi:glucose/arabinose dehydrogenase
MRHSVTRRLPGLLPGSLVVLVTALAAACGTGDPGLPTPAGPSGPTAAASVPAVPSVPATTAAPAGTAAPTASREPVDRPDLTAVAIALEPVADGLDQPVFVTGAGDGSGRLYVAVQPGRILVVEPGSTSTVPFLDIADRVTAGGERGLLGVAFPPGYGPSRPEVYVHYSGSNGRTTISRFRLATGDATRLDSASEEILLTQDQPYSNHNGGWIGFDADGMLLIGLGDGGSGGDPENRASSLDTLLGKMLRIDVLGAGGGQAYAIPDDNPFASGGGAPEILHYGLRNPFRDSIDPATGDLWIGDVGQGAWEEVDVARAGARGLDFGWRRWEGRHCFDQAAGCDEAGVTMPVAEYGHGEGCSIIGGPVYHGDAIPALRGAYLFGDYCSGTLWAIDAGLDAAQSPITLLQTGASISSIGAGDDGELYVTDLAGGRLLRVVPAG